jgi:very-long-chain (3R)-3-hydroxyacyl-CoA dehydratase
MIWLAAPHIKAQKIFTLQMPNPVNFAFDYYVVCWLVVAAYLPGFTQLFGYMLVQRQKLLGGGSKKQKRQ